MGHCSRHWCICSGRRNCRMSETNRPGKTKQVYVRNNPAQISGCRSRKDTHDRGQSQYGYTAGEKLWFTDFVGRLRVPLTTGNKEVGGVPGSGGKTISSGLLLRQVG